MSVRALTSVNRAVAESDSYFASLIALAQERRDAIRAHAAFITERITTTTTTPTPTATTTDSKASDSKTAAPSSSSSSSSSASSSAVVSDEIKGWSSCWLADGWSSLALRDELQFSFQPSLDSDAIAAHINRAAVFTWRKAAPPNRPLTAPPRRIPTPTTTTTTTTTTTATATPTPSSSASVSVATPATATADGLATATATATGAAASLSSTSPVAAAPTSATASSTGAPAATVAVAALPSILPHGAVAVTDSFAIAESKTRGRHWVATRAIPAGTLILSEVATLSTEPFFMLGGRSPPEARATLIKGVIQDPFLSAHLCGAPVWCPTGPKARDAELPGMEGFEGPEESPVVGGDDEEVSIADAHVRRRRWEVAREQWLVAGNQLKSNQFVGGVGFGMVRLSVFAAISMINHSCWPNAEKVERVQTADSPHAPPALVWAIRDIAPGEEICISYDTDLLRKPTALRRAELQSMNVSFTCECARCGPVDDRAAMPVLDASCIAADDALEPLCTPDQTMELQLLQKILVAANAADHTSTPSLTDLLTTLIHRLLALAEQKPKSLPLSSSSSSSSSSSGASGSSLSGGELTIGGDWRLQQMAASAMSLLVLNRAGHLELGRALLSRVLLPHARVLLPRYSAGHLPLLGASEVWFTGTTPPAHEPEWFAQMRTMFFVEP